MFQLNVRLFNNFSLFLTMTNYFTDKNIVSTHTKELWIEHLKQSLNNQYVTLRIMNSLPVKVAVINM